jgi:hypothetical protein
MNSQPHSKFTSNGVLINFPSDTSSSSILDGVKKKPIRLPKIINRRTFPKIKSWMNVFCFNHSDILNSMNAAVLKKLLSDIEELFFFWLNSCKLRKDRLDEYKKRSHFFKIAQAELITVQNGPRPLTFEFDLPIPTIFCNEPLLLEQTFDWMNCKDSAIVTPDIKKYNMVWQQIHLEIPIPTLQETLEQIAQEQAFIEGILPPELNSESYF